MGFMSGEERALAAALSRLGYANPFLPERIEAERAALGPAFVHADRVWSVRADRTVQNPNIARLGERAAALAATLRERLPPAPSPPHRISGCTRTSSSTSSTPATRTTCSTSSCSPPTRAMPAGGSR